MTTWIELQTATLNARQRTGDNRIGTAVRKGLYQVVTVEYLTKPKRFTKVDVLAADLSIVDAVAYLNGL